MTVRQTVTDSMVPVSMVQFRVTCVSRDELNIVIESFYKEVEKLRDAAIQVWLSSCA